ncbi:MAG TPA: hypothetical protein VFS21_33335 [Roseiflexaceae bacterium]|nr:hypothetical protein [Roseiflexaceae bacterium]
MKNLITSMKVDQVALKAADNESLTGTTLDMQGYEGVAFIATALKGEALDFSIKAQQGAASNMSDAADLASTATTFSTTVGADATTVLEVYRPQERYVRCVVTVPNATAATPTAVIAIRYGARVLPISNTGELHLSPSEGTA